jgi:hypothetical protein
MNRKHLLITLATVIALTNTAIAGELQPTPEMLAKAKRILPQQGPNDRPEYHFRRIGNSLLACAYHWGANGGFCTQTPLSLVRKIDERAKDWCMQGMDNVPHAVTGEAIVLNYRCIGGHMKREPYATAFDTEGYINEEWRHIETGKE